LRDVEPNEVFGLFLLFPHLVIPLVAMNPVSLFLRNFEFSDILRDAQSFTAMSFDWTKIGELPMEGKGISSH